MEILILLIALAVSVALNGYQWSPRKREARAEKIISTIMDHVRMDTEEFDCRRESVRDSIQRGARLSNRKIV